MVNGQHGQAGNLIPPIFLIPKMSIVLGKQNERGWAACPKDVLEIQVFLALESRESDCCDLELLLPW